MFETIISVYDGSVYSEEAFKTALNFAKIYKSEVHLLSPIHMPYFVETKDEYDAIIKNGHEYYEKLYEKVEEIAKPFQIKFQRIMIPGNELHSIISYSEEVDADLIVIGEKGNGSMKRHVLGSSSTFLIRRSNRSILVVRI
jgi:nucleotide-binding universal stress UspA family protein